MGSHDFMCVHKFMCVCMRACTHVCVHVCVYAEAKINFGCLPLLFSALFLFINDFI